jgi:hypothetical protein
MTMSVLPDDSVVIRHHAQVIHFCTKTRAINVRAPSSKSPIGGSLLATYALSSALRVRLTSFGSKTKLTVDLKSGDRLDLGELPSQDVAMVTARLIADLTRCSIELGEGQVQSLPGAPERTSAKRVEESPTPIDTPTPSEESPTLAPEGPRREEHVVSAGPAEPVFQRLLTESRIPLARRESSDR